MLSAIIALFNKIIILQALSIIGAFVSKIDIYFFHISRILEHIMLSPFRVTQLNLFNQNSVSLQ